jgi:cytoskeleton protein RodZ
MAYDIKRQPRPETSAEAVRVGEELRDARHALGFSLEEMSEQLRINRRYLAALEEGRVRDLPGVAYATGFVRSYATMLGLDAPEMVRRFREGAGVATRTKDLVFPEPVPDRGVPAGAIVMVGAVLAVAGYAGWYYWSGSSTRTVDDVPPLPPRLEQPTRDAGLPPLPGGTPPPAATPAPVVPPASPQAGLIPPTGTPQTAPPPRLGTATVGPGGPPNVAGTTAPARPGEPPVAGGQIAAPAPDQPVPAAPPPPAVAPEAISAPARPDRIVLRATQEVWLQVRDPAGGGRTVLNRTMRPGETYEVPEGDGLLLSVGNTPGLVVEVGGTPSQALAGLTGPRRDIPLDAARLRDAARGQIPRR